MFNWNNFLDIEECPEKFINGYNNTEKFCDEEIPEKYRVNGYNIIDEFKDYSFEFDYVRCNEISDILSNILVLERTMVFRYKDNYLYYIEGTYDDYPDYKYILMENKDEYLYIETRCDHANCGNNAFEYYNSDGSSTYILNEDVITYDSLIKSASVYYNKCCNNDTE